MGSLGKRESGKEDLLRFNPFLLGIKGGNAWKAGVTLTWVFVINTSVRCLLG